MTKRILAFILCIVMLSSCLFGCAKKDSKDNGAYITMYLTDDIYDFDPANAYYNSDAINVLGMMYDTLFKLNEKGKVEKSLVDSYKIVESKETNEYYIEFKLKKAFWSVKDALTAEDVVFAWKRLVDFRNDYDAASLLFDIKNARAIKEGDVSIDDLGVEAVEDSVVKVSFEGPIDYDQFFLNLTSVATAPLLRRYVVTNEDWAKKGSTIATSGPFKLGKILYTETGEKVFDDNGVDKNGHTVVSKSNKEKKISYFYLERNSYYFRDPERDAIDKSVTPYRLLVDCSQTPEEVLQNFKDGKVFYMGNIPLSLRTGENAEFIKKEAEISNALSTFVCQLNQNALIDDGANGAYLFAIPKVRQALSLAIDRQAIADAVVFAEAATGLVPSGIFDKGTSGEFRTSKLAKDLIVSSANLEGAKALITEANITPSKYSFSIKVAAYDEVHLAIAEMVKNAWCSLGFNVTVEPITTIENNDYFDQTDSVPPDVCDDLFIETIDRNNFEVIAYDLTAYSADAYSVLSNYAYAFSGTMYADTVKEIYEYSDHMTGYDSVSYNLIMEAIYYLPYFSTLDAIEKADVDKESYVIEHISTKPYVIAAQVALRKLNDAINAANAVFAENKVILHPEVPAVEKIKAAELKKMAEALQAQILSLQSAGMLATKDIVAAQLAADQATASQNATTELSVKADELHKAIPALIKEIEALEKAEKDLKLAITPADKLKAQEAYDKAYTKTVEAFDTFYTKIDALSQTSKNAANAMKTAADTANQQTLKDAIQEIYTANNIVPTEKSSKWKEQRSILLHKAEELLMQDMPVIPIIFNQDAVLVGKDISRVSGTYYCASYFRKTKLKNYNDYTFFDEESEKIVSIFKDFPNIAWDKMEG